MAQKVKEDLEKGGFFSVVFVGYLRLENNGHCFKMISKLKRTKKDPKLKDSYHFQGRKVKETPAPTPGFPISIGF